jgi:hypothetical protein
VAGSIEVCRRQASLISPEPSPSFKPVGIGLNSSTSGVLASRLSLVFLTSVQVLSHNWMMFFVTYAWSGWRSLYEYIFDLKLFETAFSSPSLAQKTDLGFR